MGTSFEWKIVVGQRRLNQWKQSWKNQVKDFMRGRNMEEDIAEDRHVWHLRVDGWLLAVQILKIEKKKLLIFD